MLFYAVFYVSRLTGSFSAFIPLAWRSGLSACDGPLTQKGNHEILFSHKSPAALDKYEWIVDNS